MKREIRMIIFDSHLHMGRMSEFDIIHPVDIKSFVYAHHVCGGAIMPTARIGGHDNFKLHIAMYAEAEKVGFDSILYVTPEIIEKLTNCYVSKLQQLKFIGLKIHPEAVDYSNDDLDNIVRFAMLVNLPLFIHTGGNCRSEAIRFEVLIKKYSNKVFVLCHARPSDQAFYLINKYPNVWIDTAFLSVSDLAKMICPNNQRRILFGSDYPINRWYTNLPEENQWYDIQINNILSNLGKRKGEDVLAFNYQKFVSSFRRSIIL